MTDKSTDSTPGRTARRKFLALSGTALAPVALSSNASAADADSCEQQSSQFTDQWTQGLVKRIRPGTKYESGVYVQGDGSGPTAVIVAGQHGFERAAQDVAMSLTRVTPTEGTVVVIPHADPTAIESYTYSGDAGNLNRDWPSGQRPTSATARAIWDEVLRYDPDVAFDLHTSRGVYADDNGLPDGVGQAVFPTPAGEETASRVIDALNEHYIEPSDYTEGYRYTKGNLQTGANPLLSHKFGGDLGIPAWLIEATRYGTSLQDRIEWITAAVTGCLSLHGIEYR